jgi:hypothetical protein
MRLRYHATSYAMLSCTKDVLGDLWEERDGRKFAFGNLKGVTSDRLDQRNTSPVLDPRL